MTRYRRNFCPACNREIEDDEIAALIKEGRRWDHKVDCKPAPPAEMPTTFAEALEVARTELFGETGLEPLSAYLNCEAFERRFSPKEARAFHAASILVSHAVSGGPCRCWATTIGVRANAYRGMLQQLLSEGAVVCTTDCEKDAHVATCPAGRVVDLLKAGA